ncbi:hypothetical protein WJX73_008146 [Symbiochloris irregularis]|uniref:Uncharacterized protein n=1 Tax=Symbiochloris irregularis TaxID=706552 RepID=A0AAW1NSE7_9CHLO
MGSLGAGDQPGTSDEEQAPEQGNGSLVRETSLIGAHPSLTSQDGNTEAKPAAVQDLGVVGRGKRRITLQPQRFVPDAKKTKTDTDSSPATLPAATDPIAA